MNNKTNQVESTTPELIPVDILEKIADSHAFELWGENIGRGEPIPLSDTNGIYAYTFPFILNKKEFPSSDVIFNQIRSLRNKYNLNTKVENIPSEYYSELKQFGKDFGSICVSARYSDGPILWMSHFLDPYFIIAGSAKEEATSQLGKDINLHNYYYFSPEEQYLEFSSGTKTIMINACVPGKEVSNDIIKSKSQESEHKENDSKISKSWARLTTPSFESIPNEISLNLVSGTDITPKGLDITDSSPQIMKKIDKWELIPIVDHTPKNWCVPSSKAMVLGFYDNYVKGKGTMLGFGRFIDYWYELTPGGFNLPNLVDEVLPPKDAAKINNYTWDWTETNGDNSKQWNTMKNEIDAGRPCFFSVKGHTTAAFGYRVNENGQKFAIVYDPPNPQTPTYVNEYDFSQCIGIGAVTPTGGTPGENLIIIEPDGGESSYTSIPIEIIWFVWGNSIQKTRISISQDGGNNWQTIADNIPTKTAWNSYTWISKTGGNRIRVKIEGYTNQNVLIAADGSFKNMEIKSSISGSNWKKIWGPTDFVITSSISGKPDPLIYAAPSDGTGIYKYEGTPMKWTKIGGPGKMFVIDDYGQLYGLSPDGNGVYRYDGTPMKWTQIGGSASAIYAGGSSLFATNPQTGDIYQYGSKPMTWNKIGGPGKMFTVDKKGRLYGISPDGKEIFRYNSPMQWTKIAQIPTKAIYSGGSGLYATSASNNDIFYYSLVPLLWTKIGGPGKMFTVDDEGRLYGISPDGNGVFRYEGAWNDLQKWTKIGGSAGKIFAAGNGRLFATNPKTNDLMSYE